MKETYNTEITVNKWDLEDILTNMKSLNERLAHISTVACMTTEDSDEQQLRAVLSLIKDSLYDIRTITANDEEHLTKIVNGPVLA